jgi:hypothetical protein
MWVSRFNTSHCNHSHVLGYNLFKSTNNFGTEQHCLKVFNRLNGTQGRNDKTQSWVIKLGVDRYWTSLQNTFLVVRFQVFTAVTMKKAVFWVMTDVSEVRRLTPHLHGAISQKTAFFTFLVHYALRNSHAEIDMDNMSRDAERKTFASLFWTMGYWNNCLTVKQLALFFRQLPALWFSHLISD